VCWQIARSQLLPTYDGKFTNSEDNTATYAILSKQNDIIQNRKINKTFISFSKQASKQKVFFLFLSASHFCKAFLGYIHALKSEKL
jgi:hypothetical protein